LRSLRGWLRHALYKRNEERGDAQRQGQRHAYGEVPICHGV